MLKKASMIALALWSVSVMAIGTGDRTIAEIGIQGRSPDEIVFTNYSGWGASGCESARFVVLQDSVNNRQEMLSLALAAKVAGIPVLFYGECDAESGDDRFNATYMIIK